MNSQQRIASWAQRSDEKLFTEALRAARRWLGQVHEMRDAELIGVAAAVHKELGTRGIIDLPTTSS